MLGCVAFTTRKLIVDIIYLIQGFDLFSLRSAASNICHRKVLDLIAAKRIVAISRSSNRACKSPWIFSIGVRLHGSFYPKGRSVSSNLLPSDLTTGLPSQSSLWPASPRYRSGAWMSFLIGNSRTTRSIMPTASAAILRSTLSSSTICSAATSKASSAAPYGLAYSCSYQYSSTQYRYFERGGI